VTRWGIVVARWVIQVETEPGVVADAGLADRVCAELTRAGALGAACAYVETNTVVAGRFSIDAASFFEAMDVGQAIWLSSLERTSIPASIGGYEQRPTGIRGLI
jgi:hypothetical protein